MTASTSITVKRYLDRQDVRYTKLSYEGEQDELFKHGATRIPAGQIARAVILRDLRGMVMAIVPGPNHLNLDALNRQLHRHLKPADPESFTNIFADCAPGIYPALGEAYQFETIVDDALLGKDVIYITSGNPNELIRLTGVDFQLLHSNAWFGNTFSQISKSKAPARPTRPDSTPVKTKSATGKADAPVKLMQTAKAAELSQARPAAKNTTVDTNSSNTVNILSKLQDPELLPPMPSMAEKIVQLNNNPYARAADLATLVDTDRNLASQIVSLAKSPIHGYKGAISTVNQAVTRVLGYDLAMNMALGIATSRHFKCSDHGPLGLHTYWRHATYCANLAHELCLQIPKNKRPKMGSSYLCGLLHNIGQLITGNLFPEQFELINQQLAQEQTSPIVEVEQSVMATNHTQVGKILMSAWDLPEEVLTCISEHHNPQYAGVHAQYVQLIILANNLLRREDIGDGDTTELEPKLLESLGLNEHQATLTLKQTIDSRDELDNMARQLAA